MQWQIQKIIEVAHELQRTGTTGASTGEQIAAAFALNRMAYLPPGYSVIEAWESLGSWQGYVKRVRQDYRHLIEGH